ncbi:hypothetical protein ABIF68_006983 [Bradyrhizobium japonicum]|nr:MULTISPECIES: hypothetical protein [Bradyrhizobium]MBR0945219.1 hypothetical protein [Bradyrhizobium liaoningense]MDI2074903.1 hypothetical protein [Bradyrhizobium sp. Mp27]
MAQHEPFMGVGDVEAPTPAPAPKKPERPLSLDERKALNWFKANSPTSGNAKGMPKSEHRAVLMARCLIEISPERKRHDPISYSITGKGIDHLKGWHDD